MVVEAGARVEDKFELERKLGQGAWGEVWLARHLQLDSPIAIKILNQDVASVGTAKQRFIREARALARVRSPYIVQVFDYGLHDGRAFLAMEYLVGETLEDRLEKSDGLTTADVARICTHIAKALQAAHDAGVVHRDVKPENVFLVTYDDEEIAKVVDFGTQKSVDAVGAGNVTLTRAGSILGTPYYMSPEQLQDSGSVDHRTDLWALGVIAYKCLTGKLPFSGSNLPNLIMAICIEPLPVPSLIASVPPGFDAWFRRAVARDRDQRFDSAKTMSRELQRVLFGGTLVTVSGSCVPPNLQWPGTNPALRWKPIDDTSGSLASLNAQIAPHRSSPPPRSRVRDAAILTGFAVAVAMAGWFAFTRGQANKNKNDADSPTSAIQSNASVASATGATPAAAPSSSTSASSASSMPTAPKPELVEDLAPAGPVGEPKAPRPRDTRNYVAPEDPKPPVEPPRSRNPFRDRY